MSDDGSAAVGGEQYNQERSKVKSLKARYRVRLVLLAQEERRSRRRWRNVQLLFRTPGYGATDLKSNLNI